MGIQDFAETFRGTIVTETMLVDGIDYTNEIMKIATFLAELKKLNRAYIAVPTRPPTENWVKPAQENILNATFQVFSEKLGIDRVEYLIGYEGNAFAFTEMQRKICLSIMAVHPCVRMPLKNSW
jgi:wyosine [tRNA(Phe)-imidazoG37] synthetase (radical SAM superfamily)